MLSFNEALTLSCFGLLIYQGTLSRSTRKKFTIGKSIKQKAATQKVRFTVPMPNVYKRFNQKNWDNS